MGKEASGPIFGGESGWQLPRREDGEGVKPNDLSREEEGAVRVSASGLAVEQIRDFPETEVAREKASPFEEGALITPERAKSTPIRNLFNWLKWPSSKDAPLLYKKVILPCQLVLAGTLGFEFALVYSAFPETTGLITSRWYLPLNLANIGIFLASTGVLTAAAFASIYIKDREKSNRMGFSNLLTVSRAFITDKSMFRNVLEKVQGSFEPGFMGELHFAPRDKATWESLANPIATIRDGAGGLHNLAVACEQSDPELEGVEVVAGILPLLD